MPRSPFRLFVVCLAIALGAGTSPAHTSGTKLVVARRLFHRGECALVAGQISEARALYNGVLDVATHIPPTVGAWFAGNAYCGLAMCAAIENDTAETRRMLHSALQHHYWTFTTFTAAPVLLGVAGDRWIDSTCRYWQRVQRRESVHWKHIDPLVIRPRHASRSRAYPMIIAFHGGNGELTDFADQWQCVADSLDVLVVIPPGTNRLSESTYSWELNSASFEGVFDAILRTPSIREQIDQRHIYLAGFSQGGFGALDLALRHPSLIRGAIIIEGYFSARVGMHDIAAARNSRAKIYGIFGEVGYVPFADSYRDFTATADSLGIATALTTVPAMGHELPSDLAQRVRSALTWIEHDVRLAHASGQH